MRSPGKALPILRRLSKPLASRRRSSTCGPGPGSGDVHLRHLVVIGVSFVIGFNERSTRGCTKRPGERAEGAKSEAGKYGRIEASDYKRSGKGGSYDLTESICQ